MPAYEYLVVTFERSSRTVFRCAGLSFEGETQAEAVEHFTRELKKGKAADLQRRRREARAANDKAYLSWVKKRDERREHYAIKAVEAQVTKGRFAMQDRVSFPDGSTRTFPKGEGAAHVDGAIVAEIGPPPPELDSFEDLTDAQLIEATLRGIEARPVDVWSVAVVPRHPLNATVSHAPLAGAVSEVLNQLGADGWRLVDVSEDRAIVGGASGTASTVTTARCTRLREADA